MSVSINLKSIIIGHVMISLHLYVVVMEIPIPMIALHKVQGFFPLPKEHVVKKIKASLRGLFNLIIPPLPISPNFWAGLHYTL